jgi:hypothetical protein
MSTQYRLVQSGKTASGGCSAGPRFVRAVAPRIIIIIIILHYTYWYADTGLRKMAGLYFDLIVEAKIALKADAPLNEQTKQISITRRI